MWIEQVYLQGFGNLKAKEIHFSKDLNLLFGFSESGKTTLAYFLLNSLGELGEELSRYEPWDTSQFGGEIRILNKHIKVDFHSGNHSPQYKRNMLEAVGFIFEDETLDISKGIDRTMVATLKHRMEETDIGRKLVLSMEALDDLVVKAPALISATKEETETVEQEINDLGEKIDEHNTLYKRKNKLSIVISNKKVEVEDYESEFNQKRRKHIEEIRSKISDHQRELSSINASLRELEWVKEKSKENITIAKDLFEQNGKVHKDSDGIVQSIDNLKSEALKLEEELEKEYKVLKIRDPQELEKVYLKTKNLSFLKKMYDEKKSEVETTATIDQNPLWEFFAEHEDILEEIETADSNLENQEHEYKQEVESAKQKLFAVSSKLVISKNASIITSIASIMCCALPFYMPLLLLWLLGFAIFFAVVSIVSAMLWVKSENEQQTLSDKINTYGKKKSYPEKDDKWIMLNNYGIRNPKQLRKAYMEFISWKAAKKDHSPSVKEMDKLESEILNALREFSFDIDSQTIDSAVDYIEGTYNKTQKIIAKLRTVDEQIKSFEQRKLQLDKQSEKLQSELSEILVALGMNIDEVLNYEKSFAQYRELQMKSLEVERAMKQMEEETDLNFIPESLEKISMDIKICHKEIKELSSELNKVSGELENIQIDSNHIVELLEKRDALCRKLETLNAVPEKLDSIREIVKKQLNEYMENYGKKFKYEFSKLFNHIVGREVPIVVERNLTIMLPLNEKRGEPERILSSSTFDQMLFAYKLSLYKILSDVELPLVIDNAFARYDDARLDNTMNLVVEEAKKRQVIILTCDKRLERWGDVVSL